mmetsp:Transcript_12273/g.17258  ORF Transcript_12273/g.17258 Transcript_12273/m.17258 type:complete len:151 (+) Transcript_12273:154-606(+)
MPRTTMRLCKTCVTWYVECLRRAMKNSEEWNFGRAWHSDSSNASFGTVSPGFARIPKDILRMWRHGLQELAQNKTRIGFTGTSLTFLAETDGPIIFLQGLPSSMRLTSGVQRKEQPQEQQCGLQCGIQCSKGDRHPQECCQLQLLMGCHV